MNRFFTAITLSLCLGLTARAQVVIINDNMFQGRMSEIRTTVVDSLTNEPVPFASVYVVPSKDTTITNFTLSDANGEAKLDEVPYGSYVFHVEMLGYKPFVKERWFRERREDMGTIRMQVDDQFLEAAVVTDVGNPIVVKQDTVEISASSFRVGANAMLKDLLRRMPGMEITDDGKVKFNGEDIDKLTVGGRTFFFGDQSTALNNLPASIVDKIRVIDRESEAARASGLKDRNREKVLDVALKKEYEKGWFGNASLKGGTTLGDDDDTPLRDDRGLLYSANALVSAYSEKDQLTLITNAQNVNASNTIFIVRGGGGALSDVNQGLSSAAQIGVNANTSRIKDVETTVSANYKYSDTDAGTKKFRTTYQSDGDLNSSTENTGKQYSNSINTSLEFKKEKGKVWFNVSPSFGYGVKDYTSMESTVTNRDNIFVNGSESLTRNVTKSKEAEFDADLTIRELWGKEGRILRLDYYGSYNVDAGNSSESTVLKLAGGENISDMDYVSDASRYGCGGSIKYSEPIGEKWKLASTVEFNWQNRSTVRDAFDASGKNDYYSSISQNRYLEQQYDLTAQYEFGEKSWITVGGRVLGMLNETFSKSYGIEETTGKDEWNWHTVPTVQLQHMMGNDRISFSVSGHSQEPSSSLMIPVLDIANPSRLSLGNVYLRPYSTTSFSGSWSRNNRKKFSTVMLFLFGSVGASSVNTASWYDTDGIMYSIPVNTQKPSLTANMSFSYTTPLDSKKIWSLSVGGGGGYTSSVSYQALTALPGVDKDNFDYSTFMSSFWGNSAGDRFYSGESGFAESNTKFFSPNLRLMAKLNQDNYSFSVNVGSSGRIARYSLDPSINMNTLQTQLGVEGSYTTKHEFELDTDMSYAFYNGYAEGYGQPEWRWNAELSKNVGAFNISVKVQDILNQTRNLTHTVTANYQEDTYRLIMGRYLLFGVKWNFGKMNASHSRRATQATWNMAW